VWKQATLREGGNHSEGRSQSGKKESGKKKGQVDRDSAIANNPAGKKNKKGEVERRMVRPGGGSKLTGGGGVRKNPRVWPKGG